MSDPDKNGKSILTETEILAIAAHELAHQRNHDLVLTNIFNAIAYSLMVLVFQALESNKHDVLLSFGFDTSCNSTLIIVGLSAV